MSAPSNLMRPESGVTTPLIRLKTVDFAGAVRADQAEKLSGADLEIEVTHGFDAAEALAQIRDFEQRRHSSHLRVKGSFWWTKPISPPGANNTITSSSSPAITSWKCENACAVSK